MKHRTKAKLLISLMLATVPMTAQDNSDAKKREWRARNFANFMLYWSEMTAVESATKREIRIAGNTSYDIASAKIPKMVSDSTHMANHIIADADIINQKYSLDKRPDYVYAWYDIMYNYEKRGADKNSDDYVLAKKLIQYIELLKELKLARYTMEVNKK